MNVGGLSQNVSLFPNFASSRGSQPAASIGDSSSQDPSDPAGIIAEIADGGSSGLVDYQQKEAAKKARTDELKSLGLTEDDLRKLDPKKKAAVEDEIAKAVKQRLEGSLQADGRTGAPAGGAEADQKAATPTTASLISSTTLGALFGLQ
jgi:hypothetical protein